MLESFNVNSACLDPCKRLGTRTAKNLEQPTALTSRCTLVQSIPALASTRTWYFQSSLIIIFPLQYTVSSCVSEVKCPKPHFLPNASLAYTHG